VGHCASLFDNHDHHLCICKETRTQPSSEAHLHIGSALIAGSTIRAVFSFFFFLQKEKTAERSDAHIGSALIAGSSPSDASDCGHQSALLFFLFVKRKKEKTALIVGIRALCWCPIMSKNEVEV
jgi:hypothetical protein